VSPNAREGSDRGAGGAPARLKSLRGLPKMVNADREYFLAIPLGLTELVQVAKMLHQINEN
jgi:hypothetical protein